MNTDSNIRPDPDELLTSIKLEEDQGKRGKLKIFFGMCAGVGKTFSMLESARIDKANGKDVVIGYVETHNRPDTNELLKGFEIIPGKIIEYKGIKLAEADLEAVIIRKPGIVLIDELAHTNVPGSVHIKRYQDILEILDTGIDVYTTLNVQHLESRTDTISRITGIVVRETVPDEIFEKADEVELVDITPDELLQRFADGKVYTPEQSLEAIRNFFKKGNITALREMSLRIVADRVDKQLRVYMQEKGIKFRGNIDVHMLGSNQSEDNQDMRHFGFPAFTSRISHYLLAAFFTILTAVLFYPLKVHIGYQIVAFGLLFTVSILALFVGIGPILLSATLSALIWDYFFLPPPFTLHVNKLEDVLMLIMYFIIALIGGIMTTRVRKQERLTRERELRTNALYQLTKELSMTSGIDEVIKTAVKYIGKYSKLDCSIILQ